MARNSGQELDGLVDRLVAMPHETSVVEFKVSNANPDEMGEYISALSNAAALGGHEAGYLVWGVRDGDHEIVGTTFSPEATKIGNEELVPWLTRFVDPQVGFTFRTLQRDGLAVVILRVEAAHTRPIAFKHVEYTRVGTYKKPLGKHPEHERELWRLLDPRSFESASAATRLDEDEVLEYLDYPAFFELRRMPLPENRIEILRALTQARVVRHSVDEEWQVTNVGALLYAANLERFPMLARKAARVIHYEGTSRVKARRERVGQKGYAAGFQGLIAYVVDQLPESEVIEDGLRMDRTLFPSLVIRELVANALIHQDLSKTGTGPMVEVFDDRVEVTNPGRPLVDPLRFIDSAPRSRNETLANELRLAGICEERGSGWDKVAFEIELHQLPPALIEDTDEYTRVSVFAPRALKDMDRADRVRATYQHACLNYVSNRHTNNATIRQRFSISERNKAQATRIITEAVEAGLIAPYDPAAGPRRIRYVPFWSLPHH